MDKWGLAEGGSGGGENEGCWEGERGRGCGERHVARLLSLAPEALCVRGFSL